MSVENIINMRNNAIGNTQKQAMDMPQVKEIQDSVKNNTAPEGATIVKPKQSVVEVPSPKSRYVFAIGQGGQKYILRLQIDLSSTASNIDLFA